MSTVVLYFWCHSDSASVLMYFTFLSYLFPLPCGAGSTVPREGFDSTVVMPFPWCVVAVTLLILCRYTSSVKRLLLCRVHSWRVPLAKQETLTPPGHLVSPLICKGFRECQPWCSTVGATVTVHQFFCILHCYFAFLICVLV